MEFEMPIYITIFLVATEKFGVNRFTRTIDATSGSELVVILTEKTIVVYVLKSIFSAPLTFECDCRKF